MPEYKVYWLTTGRRGKGKTSVPLKASALISTLKRLGVDGIDCRFHSHDVTAEFIATIKKAGFEFHAWTIDDFPNMIEAFRRGAQSVTTNCAKKQLDTWNAAKDLLSRSL
jgi:glycerophosphoryl diester phosphodiesterase